MPTVNNLEVELGTGVPVVATRGRLKGTSKYLKVVEQTKTLTRGHWLRVKASNCKGGRFAARVRTVLKNQLGDEFERIKVVTLQDGNVGVIRHH